MKTSAPAPFGLSRSLVSLVLGLAVGGSPAPAATASWTGASGTDTNWSTTGNWDAVVPTGADDVKFFNPGTNGTPGLPTSFVDAAFGRYIGSLQFGNTNGLHTIALAPNTALNITNLGGLVAGTPGDIGAVRNLTNSITGTTATLNVTNSAAQLAINQGTANNLSGMRGNLDLSSLGTFNANLFGIGLGSTVFQNPGNAKQREAGSLFLARTNLIVLGLVDTLANYQVAGRTNSLELSRNPGNNAGILSLLFLGQTNAFYVDSMGFGRDKASISSAAWMGFNPAFTNSGPVAYVRGAGGDSTRVTWWAIGDMNANASSSQHSMGTNDFTGGSIDALVNVISLGRDCSPTHTASGSGRINTGVLTFNSGTIDVNTLIVGNQALGPTTSTTPNQGFVNVGPAATLRINSNLILGNTTVQSPAASNTFGRVTVNGGNLFASSIGIGAFSATNGTITITSGTFALTNSLGSSSKPLKDLNLTNATMIFHVSGTAPIAFVTNLVTGGSGNTIGLGSVAVFGSYPVQITLIKYSVAVGGAGYNFALGSVPGAAPDAYLSNNMANAAIDIVLPTDPKPRITSAPGSYGGSPGDSVSFVAGYSGSQPLTLFWLKDGTNIVTDGPTGSGSTISGATTGTLSISSAQESDSGAYALVASNPYGAATSSPPASLILSTNDIAPIVNGPNNLTVIQDNNATFVTTVSGKPVPAFQWYKEGVAIPGETAANLTIVSAQYPADQALYSIVASNTVGMVTNSAILTVIVPPAIAVQPTSVVVTNTQAASFSVVSTNAVPPATFQWKKDGNNISGATAFTLNFSSATPADIGTYTVLIANGAGSVLSDPVTLTVNSTMTATTMRPSNGAAGICIDTPLYLSFSTTPSLRKAGTIRIFNVTNTTSPVDTVDLSLNVDNNPTYAVNVQPRLIGGESFVSFPVIISGSTAAIYPHAGVLASNQTYYVTIDNGVFTDAAGAYFVGITGLTTWQFTTKAALPDSAATNPVVAADGSGDFATVQGALDFLPADGPARRVVQIRDGLYTEIVNIRKTNVTLRGQSRANTIVAYANNANLQGSTHFRMSFKVNTNDVAIETLTVTNSTPLGGSQAEAVMVESNIKRFVACNVNICSFQDTILLNTEGSQAYFLNSLIQGTTDFIWGSGNVFFTNCEIKGLAASTMLNPTATGGVTSNGMSYINCSFTRSTGLTGAQMGRTRSITNGNAAIINCRIDDHAYGWSTDALPTGSYRLWNFGNSNLAATVAKVLTNCIPLDAADTRMALASDATTWLYGWVPQLAPNIVSQPVSQSVAGGAAVTFTVVATGVPEPTYQWTHAGTNLPGATASALTINAANINHAGDYVVIVSNSLDSVTSATATLAVGNTAPTLSPIGNYTVNPGVNVTFTNTAVDPDVPPQTLSFALLYGPTNATVDAATGVFSFRPLMSQAGSSNWCVVGVSDSAVPPGTAQQGFAAVVNAAVQPSVGGISLSGGEATFTIDGMQGPDYIIQVSTNLVNWDTLVTTNPPVLPFTWTDPGAGAFSQRYYRILLGP